MPESPHPTVVINAVGLSMSLIGPHTPTLSKLFTERHTRRMRPVLPAVTCSVQSSMLTGVPPSEHGVVGNGWYNAEQCEVQFWKQSNRLVQADKVWETARRRDGNVTTANMFWWFNMYSSTDWSVTPRPIYKADGRKLPDVYSEPGDLRGWLQRELGQFPLFKFWGPAAGLESTRWIADASLLVHERVDPTLMLIYLPHLDYPLQKLGPDHADIPRYVTELDGVLADLIAYFDRRDARVIVVSEYGIEPVDAAVEPNRVLRQAGMLSVREEEGLEILDAGASHAFAVADHQLAHVYVRSESDLDGVAEMFAAVDGIEAVRDRAAQRAMGLDHSRAGDLVLVARPGAWFTYRYWLDDARAPDFARTVDIHRKPGYDPLELFVDPTIRFPKLRIAQRLIQKKLGMRMLMDVIPLDPSLVRGSHGRVEMPPALDPVCVSTLPFFDDGEEMCCTAVHDLILRHLFDDA